MHHFESTALIEADPGAIWAILTDAPAYTSWDSSVKQLEGRIEPGAKLKVTSEVNPKRAFPVKVTELRPEERMTWTGGMPLGLFKGERTFTLTPEGGATRFTMREEYTGPLTGLMWRTIPDMQPSFEKFARGLKQRAEQGG
jgi:hypothetical protein